MSFWKKSGGRAVITRAAAAAVDSVQETRANASEYKLLHRYLRDRYADSVVLTFAQIEDLLGFLLPAPARADIEWWGSTEPVARRSVQTDCWTLAGRSASVNLIAQIVVFDRLTSAARSS